MIKKLALKRLTKSDLTFFAWHNKNRPAGNQKAVNLNANVLTGKLYPELDTIARHRQNKLGIDLWITGPAAAEPHNLQRKIIKGERYKNWRLDGEVVHNPEDTPERFDILEPDDIALLGFEGELYPHSITLLLVAKKAEEDQVLFEGLNNILDNSPMTALEGDALGDMCRQRGVNPEHPVWLVVRDEALLADEDLLEAAAGQAPSVERLLTRPGYAKLSADELQAARQEAEKIGRLGEALIDSHLRERLEAGEITAYEWTSDINAISPYDFRVKKAGAWKKLEIKTTAKDFGREFYISINELRDMANGEEEYSIGRVYQASKDGAKLRYARQLRDFGKSVLKALSHLPEGVKANSVTIRPDEAMFGEEIDLTWPDEDEE